MKGSKSHTVAWVAFMVIAIIVAISMCGCTTPPPLVEYKDVTPSLPPALLVQVPEPAVPVCTDDNCVANYLIDLHAWGVTGWDHLAAVAQALTDPVAAK
jgi:hypothetical protein